MEGYFRDYGVTLLAICAGFLFLTLGFAFGFAPSAYPVGSTVLIEEGATARAVALGLERRGVVASAPIFEFLARIFFANYFKAGAYLLDERQGMWSLASRLVEGESRLSFVKLTFPEGITLREAAKMCAELLLGCSREEFLEAGRGLEGYLFPETYFFLPGTKAPAVVETMSREFEKRTASFKEESARRKILFKDALTLASLLEGEASSTEERRVISGILWKRLSIGMPLQVDAAFKYINGKDSRTLTTEDLNLDSPYNTYRYPGLPPTPINNPGLASLEAALNPKESPYLFYLTGKDGVFRYARTHEEHVRNKNLFLR